MPRGVRNPKPEDSVLDDVKVEGAGVVDSDDVETAQTDSTIPEGEQDSVLNSETTITDSESQTPVYVCQSAACQKEFTLEDGSGFEEGEPVLCPDCKANMNKCAECGADLEGTMLGGDLKCSNPDCVTNSVPQDTIICSNCNQPYTVDEGVDSIDAVCPNCGFKVSDIPELTCKECKNVFRDYNADAVCPECNFDNSLSSDDDSAELAPHSSDSTETSATPTPMFSNIIPGASKPSDDDVKPDDTIPDDTSLETAVSPFNIDSVDVGMELNFRMSTVRVYESAVSKQYKRIHGPLYTYSTLIQHDRVQVSTVPGGEYLGWVLLADILRQEE